MFDWNGNGKHDAFDDFVTFGLVQHMIDESKKNEQPPAQNKGRTVYSHHVNDEDKTDTDVYKRQILYCGAQKL